MPTFSRPFTGTQQPTGVILHIEDKDEPSTVTITRPKSNIISLGRRPGSELEQEKKYLEEGTATFRCPVVSRKHAQIIMEDDGKVFIRDLGSHHGTYLRRPDEPISTTLFPQMRRQLHSNDIVTLGKVVARDDDLVPPVVARVEFLYTPLTPAKTPSKALRLPPLHKLQSKQPRLSPSSSGRYGLQWLAASDDSSSSSSDHDSDLEEIPALQPTRKAELISASSLISRASQVIKKLIPPTETPDHILSPSPQPPSDICSPSSPSYNSMYEYMDDDLIFGRNEMQSPTPASTGEPVIIGGWPTADDHDEFLPGLMPVSHTSLTIPTWGQDLANGLKEVKAELHNLDHFNGDRLNDLERRLDESTSLCTTLVEQLETVAHLDMPDMQAQIEALQDEQKKANEKFEAHLSDVQALKEIVRDIKAGKDDHDAQMKDSLKRFREAATEIEALRTAAKNAMVVDSGLDSLKRKRGEDEDEEADTTPKRPRRFARMALRTTATVAVGAVATWSALAFS